MAIEAENLTVCRLGRTVLHGLSLRIDDGECVSIIGPNGAGKSTLMAALVGLLPAAEGEVRLGDTPVARLDRRDIARAVAYVPQIHEGYLGFSVHEVLESARYAYVDPLEPLSDGDRRAVAAAVEACRIGHLLDRSVDTLSGGERQKVWIAAALAQQTDMLFLDEPTNALDPAHQAELIRIMREYAAGRHTLLVICHDLNLALALGGRVIALRDGRLAFDEPVEALLHAGRLEALFGTGFAIHHDDENESASIQLRV